MAMTTLKLSKETKSRLDKLKEHKRETYEDILQKTLSILNILRVEPEKARSILANIDKKRRQINPKKRINPINLRKNDFRNK